MLVLTRKAGQSIVISTSDGEIEIKVLKSRGSGQQRSIGISAPAKCSIIRAELRSHKSPSVYDPYGE